MSNTSIPYEMSNTTITSHILYFGVQVELKCDGDCEHAWGIDWTKPKEGTAPVDPGTYEGNDAKPIDKLHNRWCARQCERSTIELGVRNEKVNA